MSGHRSLLYPRSYVHVATLVVVAVLSLAVGLVLLGRPWPMVLAVPLAPALGLTPALAERVHRDRLNTPR